MGVGYARYRMNEYAPCPDCGNPEIKRVRFTWWGGFLGPLLFKQLTCRECGAKFLIKAVQTKFRRVVSWSFGLLLLLVIGTISYIGYMAPSTRVLPGRQIPARHAARINGLVPLDPDERIQFFYSDALIDIADGFYMLTDRRLVIYSSAYEEPQVTIPFSAISDIDAEFSETWIDDSLIWVFLDDDSYLAFPASPEGGGDRRMFALLRQSVEAAADDGPGGPG